MRAGVGDQPPTRGSYGDPRSGTVPRRSVRRTSVMLCQVLVAVTAVPLAAQTEPGRPVCPPDTSAPVDSTTDTLFAWIPARQDTESEAVHAFRAAETAVVLDHVHDMPALRSAPIQMGILGPQPAELDGRFASAATVVLFQVRNDGRLAGMQLLRRSWWPPLDVELQRAILRSDSERAFLPLPSSLTGQVIDLFVAVGASRIPNAENRPIGRIWKYSRPGHWVMVAPSLLRLGHPPHFPGVAEEAGIGDHVLVSFVIDTLGRADPTTVVFEAVSYREFAEEALRTIHSARYAPGTLNGCKVPVRVEQPITFNMLQ